MFFITLSILLLFSGVSSVAQQVISGKGVPFIRNYAPLEYNHQGKVWGIDHAPNGIVYFAADKGVVEFDGYEWNSFKGSAGITRSILIENDSTFFTGSDLDFGIWKRNEYKIFEYKSLYPFKDNPSHTSEEFWNLFKINDSIFFVSRNNIYIYKNQNLTRIAVPERINSSFVVNSELYYSDDLQNIYKLDDITPLKLANIDFDSNISIVGMYEDEINYILVSKNEGLFHLNKTTKKVKFIDNQLSQKLKDAKVFTFQIKDSSFIIYGTVLKGMYIADFKGNIVHHINKNKGLLNNTILSVDYDPRGQLWIGMDYGVASIDIGKKYSFMFDYRGEFGTGYSAVLDNDIFYFGTNQGLYKTQWDEVNNATEFNDLELIQGSEGQVWTVKKIDSTIFVGHDKGLFRLNGNSFEKVTNQLGFWTIIKYKQYLLGGTYNGITILKKGEEKRWVYDKQMELILGSCNQLIVERDSILWVNIPNYGIIRTHLNQELYPVNRKIFEVEKFKGQDVFLKYTASKDINVVTSTHIYHYDNQSKIFKEEKRSELDKKLEVLLPGIVESSKLNEHYEFIPAYNGFALKSLNFEELLDSSSVKVIFRKVEAFNNEVTKRVYHGAELPFEYNNIRINAIVPNQNRSFYQYRLESSKKWSEWSPDTSIELIGLDVGRHTLLVKAQVNGFITKEERFVINILPPWYKTWIAYVIYLLFLGIFIYGIYLWQRISLRRIKSELLEKQVQLLRAKEEENKIKLQQMQQEFLQAEYEQIKAQLRAKTIELAKKVKEEETKNKSLKELKKKFDHLKKSPDLIHRHSRDIQRLIDECTTSDHNTFEIQMDELHQEFFKRMRQNFPNLSNNDLRLCAYLKIGFNSKEIADLLNIQPSSVYISRSRLRKKLNMDSDDDLYGFLNTF